MDEYAWFIGYGVGLALALLAVRGYRWWRNRYRGFMVVLRFKPNIPAAVRQTVIDEVRAEVEPRGGIVLWEVTEEEEHD